ncbi:MAG: hypothetical protein RRA92_07785 [Gemmatimonadota bacterium]|nr:hypothetical protein [Gemmatimonadota bacterium]
MRWNEDFPFCIADHTCVDVSTYNGFVNDGTIYLTDMGLSRNNFNLQGTLAHEMGHLYGWPESDIGEVNQRCGQHGTWGPNPAY